MDAQTIAARLTDCGIPYEAALPDMLLTYHTLLMDWNTRMDLTAVTDEDDMLDRHYMDSLSAMKVQGLIPMVGRLIDVGTGAGFPGLPLAMALPNLQVTLLDAQQKRLTFLKAVVDALALRNVTLVHSRAEDGARQTALREQFDVAVARAVAPLSVLAEYLLPYVKVGGQAVCWKGPALQEEMEQGKHACHLLGGQAKMPILCTFPGRDWQHMLLPIDKHTATPKTYPRKAGTPSKKPLG